MRQFLEKLKTRSNQGFSLIEVLVAAGIGMAVMWAVTAWVNKTNKQQSKAERRADLMLIRDEVMKLLTDIRAWESQKSVNLPTQDNEIPLFYAKGKERTLVPLTINGQTRNSPAGVITSQACLEPKQKCRLVFFKYNGQLIEVDEAKSIESNAIKAVLTIETPAEEISRSFVPRIHVTLLDLNKDPELRLPVQTFITPGVRKILDFDPVSTANCFSEFMGGFAEKGDLGVVLCHGAINAMPAICFKEVKKLAEDMDDLVALAICHKSTNEFPQNCFTEAFKKYEKNPVEMALLCTQANSPEPLKCFNDIMDKLAEKAENEAQRLDLLEKAARTCSRAQNQDPTQCFFRLTENNFYWKSYAVKLCPHYQVLEPQKT